MLVGLGEYLAALERICCRLVRPAARQRPLARCVARCPRFAQADVARLLRLAAQAGSAVPFIARLGIAFAGRMRGDADPKEGAEEGAQGGRGDVDDRVLVAGLEERAQCFPRAGTA
jgi:hypothetical protein